MKSVREHATNAYNHIHTHYGWGDGCGAMDRLCSKLLRAYRMGFYNLTVYLWDAYKRGWETGEIKY